MAMGFVHASMIIRAVACMFWFLVFLFLEEGRCRIHTKFMFWGRGGEDVVGNRSSNAVKGARGLRYTRRVFLFHRFLICEVTDLDSLIAFLNFSSVCRPLFFGPPCCFCSYRFSSLPDMRSAGGGPGGWVGGVVYRMCTIALLPFTLLSIRLILGKYVLIVFFFLHSFTRSPFTVFFLFNFAVGMGGDGGVVCEEIFMGVEGRVFFLF